MLRYLKNLQSIGHVAPTVQLQLNSISIGQVAPTVQLQLNSISDSPDVGRSTNVGCADGSQCIYASDATAPCAATRRRSA